MHENQEESRPWLKLGALVLYFALYALIIISGSGEEVNVNYDDPAFVNLLKLLQVMIAILLFVVPAMLFAGLWTKAKLRYLGMHKRPLLQTMLVAGLGMLLAIPFIDWLAAVNQGIHFPGAIEEWIVKMEESGKEATEALTRGTSVGALVANLFVIAFTAAVSEEMLFRGVVQKVAAECFRNRHVAIWLGAVIFSACHLQFYGFLPRLFMGAYLGYLFYWSGSLWPGILAHFLNNGLIVYLTWLNNRGDIAIDTEQVSLGENQQVYVALSFIIVLVSLFLVYRIEKRNREIRGGQNLQSSPQ